MVLPRPSRTYVPTMLAVATKMCRTVIKARPVFYLLFSDNAPLLAAFEAASGACDVLVQELVKVREIGD